MILCKFCGMRADIDPHGHTKRYGHWPVTNANNEKQMRKAIQDTREAVLREAEKE